MDPRTRQGFAWLAVATVAAVATGLVGYRFPGPGHEPIVGALIWTGRLAFLVFLVPLFARPLRQLVKNNFSARLMRWRRNAGVVYGGMQSVHLVIVIMMFVQLPNPPTEAVMVTVGAAGLALAIAMLITSFPKPTKLLGAKWWKRVHKAGFYVFMTIYFYDFVVEPFLLANPSSHWPWATLTLLGMGIRILAMLPRTAKPRPA